MRALVRLFKKRWFISLLGLLLLAVLIWYAGPELSFADWHPWASEDSRLFTILLIFGGWGLYRLVKFMRARAVSANVMAAILGRMAEAKDRQTPPSAGQEEVAVLERRIQEAVAVLKKGKESRWAGSQFLYQLPWYILIGPPGSGKTTALTTSNLRFLVTDDKGRGLELRGVHGTRDCDWFFTDQAVLLDTAGRYVTQDSREEVDSAAWLGFLKLLKSYRKRRPINGVLVCVSLPDIATQSEVQTQRESQAIRLRIRELHEQLGIRFPIYLLFTKCDLLAGFTEFFDDLGKEERQQVWGMTFPVNAEPSGFSQLFQSEVDLLEKRIDDRLVWRLHQERDVQRRALVYGFPHQFASIKSIATRFINETFESTRYEMPATLRGVYFTSGIQQGTPLDRLTASLASSFGLSRDALPSFTGHGKSYFVSQLMRDVVFKEAGLANTDLRWERRRVQLQRGVVAGSVGLAGLLVAAWATSYVKNHSYVEEVSQQSVAAKTLVEKVPPSDTRLIATLPPLNAVRTLPGGYESESSVITSVAHLGLDQRGNLGGEAKVVYRDLLRTLLLPRLVLHVEDRIEDETASLDDLYASLRIYVMLGDPEHFSADSVEQWLAADLESDPAAGSRQDRQQLLAHLAALFERGPVDLPIDLDAGVIDRARARLAGISLADRTYAQILDSPRVWASVKDFRAVSAVGNAFSYVFVTDQGAASEGRVDRRYTLEGYRVFKDQIRDATTSLAHESWIMGEGFQVTAADSELERVRERVSQRYYEDYRAAWAAFLDSLTIAPMDNNLNKAIDIVHTLSGDNSPLKNLLIAVERETTLTRGDDLAEKGERATKDFFGKVGEKAQSLWQTPSLTSLAAESDQTLYPVDRFFNKLNDLVRAKDGGPVPLEETIGLLAELEGFLKGAQGVRGTQLVSQVKTLKDSVLGRLEQHAARQPRYLRKWLEVIVWQVSQGLGDRALEFLNDEWRSTVWEDYRRGLQGKYPLARRSDTDATLKDFGNFFGPGGSVDRFFREYLKDLVDTSHQIWRLPPNSPIHLSRESLVMLQRASVIQEAFFTTQDKVPLVKFALKPISMDVSIDDFYLDIDGQTFRYDHSATKVTSATWPGTRETGEVNLNLSPASASGSAGVTIDGPWAWFRLLDRSQLKPLTGGDRFEVTFDVDGRKVYYELRAASALNPFRLGELERFQCPEIL
jgi:type VI secretion system protein ImpL